MYYINDAKENYKKLKRIFKNVGGFSVRIEACDDNNFTVRFCGCDIKCNWVEFSVNGWRDYTSANVCISYASLDDMWLDILFDENGFYYSTYRNAYNKIEAVNNYGTPCWIDEVVFYNHKGRRVRIAEYSSESWKMIK